MTGQDALQTFSHRSIPGPSTHTHVHMHAHTQAHSLIGMCTCRLACEPTKAGVHTAHRCLHIHTGSSPQVEPYRQTHTHVHAEACAFTQRHTHSHAHMATSRPWCLGLRDASPRWKAESSPLASSMCLPPPVPLHPSWPLPRPIFFRSQAPCRGWVCTSSDPV